MTRRTAWFVHLAVLGVGVTGLVYGWMRYFVEPEDPDFAIVNHPLEPDFKYWHIVLAPLLVFSVGVLWRSHVWGRIVSGFRRKRRTGTLLAALVFPMIASGYLLQTALDEGWRSAWVWIHVVASCLWLGVYAWHQLLGAGAQPPRPDPR